MYLAAHAAPRRARKFFWTGGAPPPPTEIDRRAAADEMTSAHSSTSIVLDWVTAFVKSTDYGRVLIILLNVLYWLPSNEPMEHIQHTYSWRHGQVLGIVIG